MSSKSELEKRIFNIERRLKEVDFDVKDLRTTLMVENYFYKCPCCGGSKLIPKAEAVSFQQEHMNLYGYHHTVTLYTTKESYEAHLPKIKQWEKEVKEAIKNNKE